MRLLIAGGAGYLGSVLIPKLLERGYKADVVDLFWFGNHLPRQVGVLNKDIFQLTLLRILNRMIRLSSSRAFPMTRWPSIRQAGISSSMLPPRRT